MDEITAVKSVGVAGGEPLALVAIFLLLCHVCYDVCCGVEKRERERGVYLGMGVLRRGVAIAVAALRLANNLSCSRNRQKHPGATWA